MAEIISFQGRKIIENKLKSEWTFMNCDCHRDMTKPYPGFAPLCLEDKNGLIIGGLMCLACEEVSPIVNGRPA